MPYTTSLKLHESDPAYGLFIKLVIVLVPGIMAVSFFLLWFTGETAGALVLLAEAIGISTAFWAFFPRKYQVYEDHIRIVLGGPFFIRIGFDRIKTVMTGGSHMFTINFATAITTHYVTIVKHKGMSIVITPQNNEMFVENASRALDTWRRQNKGIPGTQSR